MSLALLFTLVILGVATLVGLLARSASTQDSFWLNNRQTGLFALVATLVSTQIGAGTVMGIASSTVSSGTGYGVLVLLSTVLGFVLVAVLAPKIRRFAEENGAFTLPDFIGARFSPSAEKTAALVTLIAYIGFLAGQIVALSSFLQLLGLGGANAIWVAGVGAVIYCALSGVKGDIAADCWFFLVMVASILIFAGGLYNAWPTGALTHIPAKILSPATFGGYSTLIVGAVLGALLPFVQMELWLRIFAAKTGPLAKRALLVGALACVPFCVLPIAAGLFAVATQFDISSPDTVLLSIAQHILPTIFGAFVVSSITAVILSTTNTFTLVIAGVLTRNVLPLKHNLRAQQWAVLLVGFTATLVASFAGGLVSLILGAAYVLIALCPTVLAAVFNWRIAPRFLCASMGLGALTACVAYPFLGPQAFLPNLIVSFTCLAVGWVVEKRKSA